MFLDLHSTKLIVETKGEQKKNPKKSNRLRNQIKTVPKNGLTKSIGSVLILFFTILSFGSSLDLQNTKTMV